LILISISGSEEILFEKRSEVENKEKEDITAKETSHFL